MFLWDFFLSLSHIIKYHQNAASIIRKFIKVYDFLCDDNNRNIFRKRVAVVKCCCWWWHNDGVVVGEGLLLFIKYFRYFSLHKKLCKVNRRNIFPTKWCEHKSFFSHVVFFEIFTFFIFFLHEMGLVRKFWSYDLMWFFSLLKIKSRNYLLGKLLKYNFS